MSNSVSENFLTTLRRYAAPFENQTPDIISRFPGGKEPLFPFEIGSDRGLAILLLCASLYKYGGEDRATRTITGLFSKLGIDIFKLNRVPFETLQSALKELSAESGLEDQKQVPGILRSVCDFFYQVGSLGKWLADAKDWETCTRELSEGIFWMGKLSRRRIKPRYFLWLASFRSDFAARFPQAHTFQWPVDEGHERFYLDILVTNMKKPLDPNPEKRLRFFSGLCQEVFPQAPWKLFQPLNAYLRPEKEDYLCRKIQMGCQFCALKELCPVGRRYIASG